MSRPALPHAVARVPNPQRLVRAIRGGIVALVCALMLGCHRKAPDDPLALVTTPIDTRVTVGEWRQLNPSDTVGFDPSATEFGPEVCRVARRQVVVAGMRLTRVAVFELPEAPAGEVFPDTTQLANRRCRLKAIALTRVVPDSLQAQAMGESLEHLIAVRVGAGVPGEVNSRTVWAKSWPRDSGTIALTIVPAPTTHDENTNEEKHFPPVVRLVATDQRPRAIPTEERLDIGVINGSGVDAQVASQLERAYLDSKIRLVDIEPAASDLRGVAARVHLFDSASLKPDTMRDAPTDSLIASVMRTIADSTPSLAPPRRASLLLATDLALAAYADVLNSDPAGTDAKTKARLVQAGIVFDNDPTGAVDVYSRRTLRDAYRADSASAAGHMAFDLLLARGWSTRAACGDSVAGPLEVIARGEAALRTGSNDALTHYLVGEAYQDIVSVAEGGGAGYVDRINSTISPSAARAKAIEHFHAALGGLTNRELRRNAWNFAVRLAVGARVGNTFVCIYD